MGTALTYVELRFLVEVTPVQKLPIKQERH